MVIGLCDSARTLKRRRRRRRRRRLRLGARFWPRRPRGDAVDGQIDRRGILMAAAWLFSPLGNEKKRKEKKIDSIIKKKGSSINTRLGGRRFYAPSGVGVLLTPWRLSPFFFFFSISSSSSYFSSFSSSSSSSSLSFHSAVDQIGTGLPTTRLFWISTSFFFTHLTRTLIESARS